jgi:SNF2 family DNA or RNA helicase
LKQSQREFCGKWKVLKRLLDYWHSNGDKVLVFSHSVRLLRLMKTLFDLDGTKYNFNYLVSVVCNHIFPTRLTSYPRV